MSPSREQIVEALERIQTSDAFRQSERLRGFLSYIVMETVEGRGDRIKSYSVGLEVFGRKQDADMASDAIVRTTAIRLRDALDRYYRLEGQADAVVITLPKGRYVPEFVCRNLVPAASPHSISINFTSIYHRWRGPRAIPVMLGFLLMLLLIGAAAVIYALSRQAPVSRSGQLPAIVVSQSDVAGDDSGLKAFGTLFSNQLAEDMVSVGAARIVGPLNSGPGQDAVARQIDTLGANDTIISLDSSISGGSDGVSVHWRLADARSGVILWAGDDNSVGAMPQNATSLAELVAFKIMGMDGALPILLGRLDQSDETAACIPNSQRLIVVYADDLQVKLRDCLEQIVRDDPGQGEAWALLSQLYTFGSETEFSFGRDGDVLRQKASDAAQKALDFDPQSFLTQQALLMDAFARGDIKSFDATSLDMLKKYPGDPNLKVRIGARLIRLGRFEQGRQLVEGAIRAKETPNPGDYLSLVLALYGQKDYAGALDMAARGESVSTYLVPLLRTVTFSAMGRSEEAKAQLEKLLALRPDYGNFVYRDLLARHVEPTLLGRMIEDLRRAGLVVPDQ
ncbi:MAG TPA: tetratricopeptide repeat protein [Devosiaceae bacterium]